MTERYLENGLRALESGTDKSKTTIVLIPGWPQTAEACLPVFPHLEAHYNLLAIDPPGLGHSAPPPDGNYGAVSVSKLLMKAVHSAVTTPYHLVGHDIGAWLAYPWALQASDKLLSVTMIDASIGSLATKPLPFPLPYPANLKLFQFSFCILPELPEILTAGKEREFLDFNFKTKALYPDRIPESARKVYLECYSREGAMGRGFEYYRAAAGNIELEKKLASEKSLTMPVIAIGGDHSSAGGIVAALKPAAQGSFHGFVIEDCGHYVMEEQTEKLCEILLQTYRNISG